MADVFNNFSNEFKNFCGLNPVKDKPRIFVRKDGLIKEKKEGNRTIPVYMQCAAMLRGNFLVYDPYHSKDDSGNYVGADVEVGVSPRKVKNANGDSVWEFNSIKFEADNDGVVISKSDSNSNNLLYALILNPQNLDNPLRSQEAREKGMSIPEVDYAKPFFGENTEVRDVSSTLKKDRLLAKCLNLIEISDTETRKQFVRANSAILKVIDPEGDDNMIEVGLNIFAKSDPEYFYSAWGAADLLMKAKLNAYIKADLIKLKDNQWISTLDNTVLCIVDLGQNSEDALLNYFEINGTAINRFIKEYDKLKATAKQIK